MPISSGLTLSEDSKNGVVTPLLVTSDTAFSKTAGYAMTNYEKESGDIDGPFALAVSIQNAGEGQIVWFTSSYFLEDLYNYNYLTISSSTAALLKVLMIGIFPLLYLGIGVCVVLKRRRLQNESL